jgi:hypothetical protein
MLLTRLTPLLLLVAAAACGAQAPANRLSGTLERGATITATTFAGNISLYAPERGKPDLQYEVESFGPDADLAKNITVERRSRNVRVTARAPSTDLLLRAPRGTTANLQSYSGTINVADYDGVVNAQTGTGDIKMLLPQYGNAHAHNGNVSVIFASAAWPGTLRFSADKGDVELYVNETAVAHVHLYAMHGTIFTDFPLKGTARGASELIDGAINAPRGSGPVPRGIDVFVRDGSIRLLQLKPQV